MSEEIPEIEIVDDTFRQRGLEALAKHFGIKEENLDLIGRIMCLSELKGILVLDEHKNLSGQRSLGKYDILTSETITRDYLEKQFKELWLPEPEVLFDNDDEPVYSFERDGFNVELHIKKPKSWRTIPNYKEEK